MPKGRPKRTSTERSQTTTNGTHDNDGQSSNANRRSTRQRVPSKRAVSDSSKNLESSALESAQTTNAPEEDPDANHGSSSNGAEQRRRPKRDSAQSAKKDEASKKLEKSERMSNNFKRTKTSSTTTYTIEECTARLLEIDGRERSRRTMLDANNLLQSLLVPMDFPWSHAIVSPRPVPTDIDEMQGLLYIGSKTKNSMYTTKSEVLEEDEDPTITINRSSEPGVLEIKTSSQPSSTAVREYLEDDPARKWAATQNPGELLLSTFLETQSAKRRRLDLAAFTERKLISIRFGSASSCQSIIPNRKLLLLPALFAPDYQRGRRMRPEKADEVAAEMGTYDYRYGLPPLPHGTARVRSGRTRIMWSTKDLSGPRPTYRSLITGAPLDSQVHKRPLAVAVSIRLQGKLIEDPFSDHTGEVFQDSQWKSRHVISKYPYSDELIEEALRRSCESKREQVESQGSPTLNPAPLQCSIDPDHLGRKILLGDSKSEKIMKSTRAIYHVCLGGQPSSTARGDLIIRPPFLQSLPAIDGVIRTFCMRPGEISATAEASQEFTLTEATNLLLHEVSQQSLSCSVCWSTDLEKSEILQCSTCLLRVHADCHPRSGRSNVKTTVVDETWQCNICRATSKGKNGEKSTNFVPICSICGVGGGAMRPVDEEGRNNHWVHDICQVWCGSTVSESGTCALCGKADTQVTRCAAKGCSVTFHPMCATITSKAAALHASRRAGVSATTLSLCAGSDAWLTTQYTLAMTQMKSPQFAQPRNVPIALCGHHNPKRRYELQGMNPSGAYIDVDVPPLRK